MEPLNKDTFGTSHFVLLYRGCPLSEVIFYRMCTQEYFRLVLLLGGLSSFRVSFIGGFNVMEKMEGRGKWE